MDLLIQILLSFIATSCFGVIFNAPTKVIPYCGFVGSIGWSIYYMLTNWQSVDTIQATFLSAFFVAFIAHLFARSKRMPVIVFSVSGIITLVPGGIAYNAMRNIVEQDYNTAIQNGMLVFMISGAIAMGLVFAEVIMQILLRFMREGITSIESFVKQKTEKKIPSKFKKTK
jgi:uncharacterized membrane protein YjjB (DUF3815 family)